MSKAWPDLFGNVPSAVQVVSAVQLTAPSVLELTGERGGVAAVGILGLRAPQQQHRQLGEIVAGQDVEAAALEHLPHRGEPVAVEAGTVANPKRPHVARDATAGNVYDRIVMRR